MDSTAKMRYVLDHSDFIHTISVGAFGYKKSANIGWKLWSLYNIISITSILTGNFSYTITEEFTLKNMTHLTLCTMVPIMTLYGQKVCHEFSENWTNLKKIVDEDFVGSLDAGGDFRHNERLKRLRQLNGRRINNICRIISIAYGMITCAGFLSQYFQPDVTFGDKFNYLYPIPGIHRITTRKVFLLVNLLQTIANVPLCVTMGSTWLLTSMLVLEISSRIVALEERMKSVSQEVHRNIALVREYETKTDTKKSPLLMKLVQQKCENDTKICFQIFEENLKVCIRHHQIIIRAIRLLRPLLNGFFTTIMIIFVMVMIGTGFLFVTYKELQPNTHVLRIISAFSASVFQLALQCLMAQHLQNDVWSSKSISDRIAEQVYSLPWYELPPTLRKNVYIFLCQAQAPIKFHACKTFRISTYFLPTVLNFAYNNIVNLLTIQKKYRNN